MAVEHAHRKSAIDINSWGLFIAADLLIIIKKTRNSKISVIQYSARYFISPDLWAGQPSQFPKRGPKLPAAIGEQVGDD